MNLDWYTLEQSATEDVPDEWYTEELPVPNGWWEIE
jgi:hypothetical protein